ncbi:MAG: hypothetical protein QM652_08180 [Legionella sp.]|uniref:hypothetical protein n=1 Tax=Legionella sp. TaxID=459 RepID=UPI0039E504BB
MNEGGICNGLATLHAAYALKGEPGKFEKILKFIADGIKEEGIENEDIDVFAIQVAATFEPEQYNLQLSQSNAVEMLSVNGYSLKSSYNLALVTDNESWESVFKELALKNNEVLQVSNMNHAISIQKINNVYTVYDPNYSEGYKNFTSEKDLIKELHKNVFGYKTNQDMGLYLNVIRHPQDNAIRTFPEITSIYDKFLLKENAKATLSYAALNNDGRIIDYLLNKGADDIENAVALAVVNNNYHALPPLLSRLENDNERYSSILLALQCGRKEAFDVLMQNQDIKTLYNDILGYKRNNVWHIKDITKAAKGGNPQLLKNCIEQRINYVTNLRISAEIKTMPENIQEEACALLKKDVTEQISVAILALKDTPEDPLLNAVQSGSDETVKVLIEQLHKTGHQLDDADKIKYLQAAISHNHLYVASCLINEEPKISSKLLNCLHMDTWAVERTNITLLNLLKEKGMEFSSAAQKVIDYKNQKSLTFIDSLGIAVAKFTDFIKDNLFNRKAQGVTYEPRLFKQMKQSSQESKPQITDDDLNTPKV